MSVPKVRLFFTALGLSILLLGVGSTAAEAKVRVVVQTPFYPRAEFQHDRGYFRTHDGHYYHYDRDRDGWHHGRNHREGLRRDRH